MNPGHFYAHSGLGTEVFVFKNFCITVSKEIQRNIVLPRISGMVEVQISGKVPGNLFEIYVYNTSTKGHGAFYNYFHGYSGSNGVSGVYLPSAKERAEEKITIRYYAIGREGDYSKDYLYLQYADGNAWNIGEIRVDSVPIVVNKRTIIKLNCKDIYRNRIKAN